MSGKVGPYTGPQNPVASYPPRVDREPSNDGYRPPGSNPNGWVDGRLVTDGIPLASNHPAAPLTITTATVKKVVLYTFSALSALIGLGTLRKKDPVTTIAFFTASAGTLYVAWTMKDYEDPIKLDQMKTEAQRRSFQAVVAEHGLDNIVRHQILDLPTLQDKFIVQYTGRQLIDAFKEYSLEKITEYSLATIPSLRHWLILDLRSLVKLTDVSQEHLQQCCNAGILKRDEHEVFKTLFQHIKDAETTLSRKKERIDVTYPNRRDRILERLDLEEKQAREAAGAREETLRNQGLKQATAQADRQGVVDAVFTGQTRGRLAENYVRSVANGAEIAGTIARNAAQSELEEKLANIERKRVSALRGPASLCDQRSYDSAIKTAEDEYQKELDKVDRLYRENCDALYKSLNVR